MKKEGAQPVAGAGGTGQGLNGQGVHDRVAWKSGQITVKQVEPSSTSG